MCDACRTYQKTSDILDRKLSEQLHHEPEVVKEIEEKKEALLNKLNLK